MKKINIICIMFLLITIFFSMNVKALEIIDEATETIITAEETTTEKVETTQETVTDTLILTEISNNILAINWILIFMLFMHFTEKWLKIGLNANDKSGKVG